VKNRFQKEVETFNQYSALFAGDKISIDDTKEREVGKVRLRLFW
jgi:hypothetical protein